MLHRTIIAGDDLNSPRRGAEEASESGEQAKGNRDMTAKKTAEKLQSETVDAAMAISEETVEKFVEAGEKAMRTGQDALALVDTKATIGMARDQMETANKTIFAGHEQVTSFNMAVFDAYATAFEAMRAGAEVLGKEVVDFTRETIETSVENNKSLMASKTFNEALDKRNQITRSAFDTMIAESAKLTEMSLKTANDGWAPIQNHASQAFSSAFKTPAA